MLSSVICCVLKFRFSCVQAVDALLCHLSGRSFWGGTHRPVCVSTSFSTCGMLFPRLFASGRGQCEDCYCCPEQVLLCVVALLLSGSPPVLYKGATCMGWLLVVQHWRTGGDAWHGKQQAMDQHTLHTERIGNTCSWCGLVEVGVACWWWHAVRCYLCLTPAPLVMGYIWHIALA